MPKYPLNTPKSSNQDFFVYFPLCFHQTSPRSQGIAISSFFDNTRSLSLSLSLSLSIFSLPFDRLSIPPRETTKKKPSQNLLNFSARQTSSTTSLLSSLQFVYQIRSKKNLFVKFFFFFQSFEDFSKAVKKYFKLTLQISHANQIRSGDCSERDKRRRKKSLERVFEFRES
jgi:hypothetical protein